MALVYVDDNGFVRASDDNRILGIKTGAPSDGHIVYTANGVRPGDNANMKPLPRITPEIAAMVRQVMAHADLYPSEDHRLKEAIVQALWDVMEGDGG